MPQAQNNAELAARAERVIPGGVNSSNRRLAWPLAVVEASGAYFTDADGMRYLDYHAAFGPLILGHNHPQVNAAVRDVLGRLELRQLDQAARAADMRAQRIDGLGRRRVRRRDERIGERGRAQIDQCLVKRLRAKPTGT